MKTTTTTAKPTTVKGPWFVVNMTTRWKQRKIERGDKPTHVHRTLLGAVTQAQRSALKYPNQHFAVFECVGYFKAEMLVDADPVAAGQ